MWGGFLQAVEREDFELPSAEVGVPVAAEVIGEIEAIAGTPVLGARVLRKRSAAGPRHSAETCGAVVVFEREAEVALGEGAGRSEKACAAGDEDGVGVAEAEGSELLERGEEVACDVGEAELEIEGERRFGGEADVVGGDAGEGIPELRDVG